MSFPNLPYTIQHGHAQHFICSKDCLFHLATEVIGKNRRVVISTIGDCYLPKDVSGIDTNKPQEIGCGRTFETFVFKCSIKRQKCGCPVIKDWCEIEGIGANSAQEASLNHNNMVESWLEKLNSK